MVTCISFLWNSRCVSRYSNCN